MKLKAEQLELLKRHGFKWLKDGSTDTVDASCIQDVLPAANGFTVVYNETAVALEMSTAVVELIDIPANPETHYNDTDLDLLIDWFYEFDEHTTEQREYFVRWLSKPTEFSVQFL